MRITSSEFFRHRRLKLLILSLQNTKLLWENQKKIESDPNAFQKILSPREIHVLAEVAKGFTSQEIAETLRLSKRTVENHRHRIMKRLQIKNVSGLVRFAMDHNLVALS